MKVAAVVASLLLFVEATPQEGYNYQVPSSQGPSLPGSGSGQFPTGPGQSPSGSGQYPSGSGQFPTGSGQNYPSAPASYNFKYDVNDSPSGNFFGHEEQREGINTQGRYYVQLPDGRRLTVEYYVDNTGYHPTLTYEGEAQFPSGQGYQGGPDPNQGFPQGGGNQGFPQGGNQGFPQGGGNQGFPQGGGNQGFPQGGGNQGFPQGGGNQGFPQGGGNQGIPQGGGGGSPGFPQGGTGGNPGYPQSGPDSNQGPTSQAYLPPSK